MHAIFATAVTACGVLATIGAIRLLQARHINAAIAGASVVALDSSVPEALVARAIALDKVGDYDGSLLAYKAVTQGKRSDLRRLALYNLGNLHMRMALRNVRAPSEQLLPLLELAKQSYRDLLRETPQDWDARYNLERALYLAPESAEDVADEEPPAPKEHTISTVRAKMDLP